jgi:ATP-dependent Clp protease ATP-binding subunit ClpC
MEITEAAKDFLSDKGYDPEYGARPLHRAIQKWLEDPLAEEMLSLKAKEGDTLFVDRLDGEEKLHITLKGKEGSKKAKKESN